MELTAQGLRVSLQDVFEKRAYIHLSPEAKIKLCELAGAPFAEKNPGAKLSDLQREVLSRQERLKIVNGGSGLGKSTLGGCEGLCALILPFRSVAYVAARYEHVAKEFQYVIKGFRKLFADQQHAFTRFVFKNQAAYHEYHVETIWGSLSRGYTVDVNEGEVLLGSEFTDVILGEGSHIPQEITDRRIKRAIDRALTNNALGQELGYLSVYTTPKEFEGTSSHEWDVVDKAGRGDLTVFNYGKVPFQQTVWLREADVLENPAYDRETYYARQRTMDADAFAEQYQGKRRHASGRVYKAFNESRDRVPMPGPTKIAGMRLGLAVDTGAFFGCVLAGLDRDRHLWCLGNVKTEKVHLRESCRQVRHMLERVLGPVFDSADFNELMDRLDLWTIDPASQQKLEVSEYLNDAPFVLPSREKGKFELLATIDQVVETMVEGRFKIVDECGELLEELRKYTWKRTKTGDKNKLLVIREPVKANDHCLDAMRFIAIPLLEDGPKTGPIEESANIYDHFNRELRESITKPLTNIMERAAEKDGLWC